MFSCCLFSNCCKKMTQDELVRKIIQHNVKNTINDPFNVNLDSDNDFDNEIVRAGKALIAYIEHPYGTNTLSDLTNCRDTIMINEKLNEFYTNALSLGYITSDVLESLEESIESQYGSTY